MVNFSFDIMAYNYEARNVLLDMTVDETYNDLYWAHRWRLCVNLRFYQVLSKI